MSEDNRYLWALWVGMVIGITVTVLGSGIVTVSCGVVYYNTEQYRDHSSYQCKATIRLTPIRNREPDPK